ncbi:MAG: ABC transporter substrate-binding protein [Clostridia bacterium]|nr:ABC transporter substrate-binding protein [Clostridia bacterium]
MKQTKSILALVLGAILLLAAVGCTGSGNAASAEKTYTVGICQLVQHDALDAATQGFMDVLKEKLGDKVAFDVKNGSGDPSTCATICNQFVSEEVDLIMANATPAVQAAQAATNKIPVVGTSVTDYGAALGIDNFGAKTGTNVTGTSDRVPEEEQAKILQELFPDAKTLGILYCSAEANSKVQAAAYGAAAKAMGYTVVEFTFADSNDLAAVTQTACDECDVIYVPTDNTAASNAELINNIANTSKTPILAGEESICRHCGIATLSISYYELGRVTGEMAYEILVNGKNPGDMEIRYAPFGRLYNAANSETVGVAIPDGYEPIV